ncbi:MAG TPA: type II secretion system protein [Fimbriimonadaceae bacterium]|nr:type II secretion system protein [Fimbriimonadaceae bacterium]
MAKRRGTAFTLVELLVVLAISGVLLTIIAIPMVNGFNLTRASQAYAEAQSASRAVRDLIVSDIGQGAGVRFNPTPPGGLNLELPVGLINFTGVKIDILLPAEGDPTRGASGAFIDPDTGKEDPTLSAPKGQVTLPASPGLTIVRYWIGLRTPLADLNGDGELQNNPYNDPYSGLLMPINPNPDNLYVLYRAEVQPLKFDTTLQRYVPNSDYFADADGDGKPDFDDPDFFRISASEVNGKGQLNAAGLEKVKRINNWKKTGQIVTQLSRYDMIQVKFNPSTKKVFGDERDGIVPLIRFQPRVVSEEAVKGQNAIRQGEETDNPTLIGPDSYVTRNAQWSGATLRINPSTYVPATGPVDLSSGAAPRDPSRTLYPLLQGKSVEAGGDGMLYSQTSAVDQPVAMFDMGLFKSLKASGAAYPFNAALLSADNKNTANGLMGARLDLAHTDLFIPVVTDERKGEIAASFDIRDYGSDTTGLFAFWENRLPSDGTGPGVDTGPADTPNSDTNVATPGTPWSSTDTFRTINNKFNNVWDRWNDFAPTLDRSLFAKRFVNLAQEDQPGGVPSPLNRLDGMARASITPGSEEVSGPDQRPGPNYGKLIRYSRVSAKPVGPNQYYINYTDMPEPDWSTVFAAVPSYDPKVFDPNSFVSAVLQPQYRAGYIEFNSRFGEPIPPGKIYVSYRFQFTQPNDRVVVDYNTGDSIDVVLTIKNFPQSATPFAQSVTAKGSARVRNFFR